MPLAKAVPEVIRMTEPSGRGTTEHVACELCRSAESVQLITGARDYITGEVFALRHCRRCAFAQTEPRPISLAPYYPVRYRRYHRLTAALLQQFYRWRAWRWVSRLGRSGAALEIGCGDGWMLQALREQGWQVVGTERSVESALVPAQGRRVPVFVGELDALRPAARFDAIILFHVLEHMPDPVAVLRNCAALLKPGGMIIVAVPNWRSWQARCFGTAWFHLDVPRHLNHFSRRALSLAAEQAGLQIARTSYVSLEHDPYGWVQSSLNRCGFSQNLLTKRLMGMPAEGQSAAGLVVMVALGALLMIPAGVLALASWCVGTGAVMEVWATKR